MTRHVPEKNQNPMERLRDNIESTFERFWPTRARRGGAEEAEGSVWSPAAMLESVPSVDMQEDENEIRVTAEMPGLDKDDFKVEVVGNRLNIRGEKKSEREEKKEGEYYYSERSYGSFSRTLALPAEVDPARAEAEYKNGVLELRLPKTEEAKARQIKVKVS